MPKKQPRQAMEVVYLSDQETSFSDDAIAALRTLDAVAGQLSKRALLALRLVLRNSYGQDFEIDLSDEEVGKLGVLFLTIFAERLALEFTKPELPIIQA